MATTIQMTPQELRDAASTLDSQLSDLLDTFGQMNSTIETTCGNWQGDAMTAFKDTFDEIYSELTKSVPETVEGIEQLLNGAADSLETADADIASAMSL